MGIEIYYYSSSSQVYFLKDITIVAIDQRQTAIQQQHDLRKFLRKLGEDYGIYQRTASEETFSSKILY